MIKSFIFSLRCRVKRCANSTYKWCLESGHLGLCRNNTPLGLIQRKSSDSFVVTRGNGRSDCTSLVGYFSTERAAMEALLNAWDISPEDVTIDFRLDWRQKR